MLFCGHFVGEAFIADVAYEEILGTVFRHLVSFEVVAVTEYLWGITFEASLLRSIASMLLHHVLLEIPFAAIGFITASDFALVFSHLLVDVQHVILQRLLERESFQTNRAIKLRSSVIVPCVDVQLEIICVGKGFRRNAEQASFSILCNSF